MAYSGLSYLKLALLDLTCHNMNKPDLTCINVDKPYLT